MLKAGSKSFTATFVRQEGKNYFYKITAVGKPGEGSGFYINDSKTAVAVANIK